MGGYFERWRRKRYDSLRTVVRLSKLEIYQFGEDGRKCSLDRVSRKFCIVNFKSREIMDINVTRFWISRLVTLEKADFFYMMVDGRRDRRCEGVF